MFSEKLYSKDDMILWSIIDSMTMNIGKIDAFSFSSTYLFNIFKISCEKKINIFELKASGLEKFFEELKECPEKNKIKNLLNDFKMMRILKEQIQVEKQIISDKNIKYLTYFCKDYPVNLKFFKNSPFVLYYLGKKIKNTNLKYAISIVGTRTPEENNLFEFTNELIKNLKNKIIYNISGLALGCDTIGHKVTLNHNIKNIAILGQGLGQPFYPKENIELANKILENGGTILSEIPPSLNVKGAYLLKRNRLQVYLTNSLFILESGTKGGTITTLKYALANEKKIYVKDTEKNRKLFNSRNISKIIFFKNSNDINNLTKKILNPQKLFFNSILNFNNLF